MLRKEKSSLAEKAARTAFFLYIIFMLIGTAPPFQEDVDITRKSTSNPINQIVDSLIPFVSLLCLWPRRKTLLLLLKEEKYLSLFFAWCLFTILWSDFPLNSFKVCVRLFGSTMVILALLLNLKSPAEALIYFKAVFAFYIPVSFLAIAFVPAATQWEWPAWRGLADHKNTLGQISFIAILVWAFAVCGTPVKKRIGSWLFLFASLILLFGSKSTTPLITLISLVLMGLCLIIDRRFGRLISSTVIVCSLFAVLLVNAFSLEELTGAFGKDTTFTQRDDIWAALIREAKIHPFIVCGL